MLNILFDYQIFSLQEFGGISRYFSEISWRINRHEGIEASVFCPLSVNHYLTSGEKRLKFKIPLLPKTGKLIQLVNRSASRIYAKLRRFDIVHKTYYLDHGNAGRPTVITVYDMINEIYPHFFPDDESLKRQKIESIKNADAVICISHNTKKDLLHFIDIDPERVFVTHLGFPDLPYDQHSSINIKGPFILYVGKRGGHKNFSQLIRGFAASKKLKSDFHIVCMGDLPFDKDEIAFFHEVDLNVDMIHHIAGDDRQLASAYHLATAFVYPSLYEGFGIPVLEAMSCQCPVICSNAGSLPEVAGQAAQLFDPSDVDAICYSLEKVLYSSQRLNELTAMGEKQCKRFSWDRCAKETIDIYRSI